MKLPPIPLLAALLSAAALPWSTAANARPKYFHPNVYLYT